jgi:hypothetical protein
MPIVRKQLSAGGATAKLGVRVRAPALELSLPEERSVPSDNMLDYSWLIYGEKKIGKTSLCAQFPNAFFLMCEPGGRALRIFQRPVSAWPEFVGYVDMLLSKKSKHGFRTVVIDTIDQAYDRCFEHMCVKLMIEHPHDENDYGKSWGQIEAEFVHQINRLLQSDLGVVFISHAVTRKVETASGEKFDRLMPSMPGQALKFLTATVDIWAYYGYDGSKHVLRLRGNDYVSAGVRNEENFLHTDDSQVELVRMGNSSKEAFSNLQKAFKNELPPLNGAVSGPRKISLKLKRR